MKNIVIAFAFLATIATAYAAVSDRNYCAKTCKDYATNELIPHIGCAHNKQFKPSCPRSAKMIDMTPALQKILVDAHNEKRNFIAGGGDVNHSPACRMATMKWDKELAELAALNVMQCDDVHDKCHNTDAFLYSGQSLSKVWTYPEGYFNPETYKFSGFNVPKSLYDAVQGWFNEVVYSRQDIIDKYPSYYSGPAIGHFTVMMADRNTHLGCAASYYSFDSNATEYFLVACNYATTNMIEFPIYNKCPVGGSKCSTGTNKLGGYPNLCSVNEKYSVNNWS